MEKKNGQKLTTNAGAPVVDNQNILTAGKRCPFHSYHRDGTMRVDGNYGGTRGYEPNSFGEWQQQPQFAEPPLDLEGAAGHWDHREDTDYYTQPGLLFRAMSPKQKEALFGNTARAIGTAPKDIQLRHIGNCTGADPAYGQGMAEALGLAVGAMAS